VGRLEVNFTYLAALLFSLAGLALLDFRFKLAFAKNAKAAAVAIAIPYLIFVIWDVSGIALGIFFKGESKYLSGVMLAHEFPLEEAFFLGLLCYTTLIVSNAIARMRK
jgi:lycopene cyclase domain-containing protein